MDKVYVFDEFDFMALRFRWTQAGGNDLDIKVMYENNGTVDDNQAVGWSFNNVVPSGSPGPSAMLWWARDSVTSNPGIEAVLIGIKQFIAAHSNSPNIIEVGIYVMWRGVGNGQFNLELKTYLGGTINLPENAYDFENPGGTTVTSITAPVQTLSTSYVKKAILKYNKTTKNAILQIL